MKEAMEFEVDLGQLLRVLKKRAKYIFMATLIFAVIGMTVCASTPPVYQVQTKMIINAGSEGLTIGQGQLASSMKLVDTCAVLIRDSDVLQPIIDQLDLPETSKELAGKIRVESVNETPVMEITVKYSDPELARVIASKIREIAPAVVENSLEGGKLKPVETIVGTAAEIKSNIVVGMIKYGAVGFVLSAALFVVLFLMDNTFHTERELRHALDLPVLGVVPSVESCRKVSTHRNKRKGF